MKVDCYRAQRVFEPVRVTITIENEQDLFTMKEFFGMSVSVPEMLVERRKCVGFTETHGRMLADMMGSIYEKLKLASS